MRPFVKLTRLWLLVLSVVIAAAGTGIAAQKVGKTGKTKKECDDDYDKCDAHCWEQYPGTSGADVFYKYLECTNTICSVNHRQCVPAAVSTLDRFGDIVVKGQLLTVEDMNRLASKVDNLAAQLGAALPADLVPTPGQNSSGPLAFCESLGPNKLRLHVSNLGNVAAPASTTHVEFANGGGGVDLPTPALAAGASAILDLTTPAACYDSGNRCSFTIVVDSAGVVSESNEANNSAAGLCDAS